MSKSTYAQKLLDPNWQRRKSERLTAEGFKCQKCGDTTTTLHVHHTEYRKNVEPWQYPDECLLVLCEPCHAQVEVIKSMVKEMINDASKDPSGEQLETILGALAFHRWTVMWQSSNPNYYSKILAEMFSVLKEQPLVSNCCLALREVFSTVKKVDIQP